jgi:hypothetical protein
MHPLERVVEVLNGVTPDYIDEYTLQAQLADALERARFQHVSREHILSDKVSRIDLLVDIPAFTLDVPRWRIGIEVKIAGTHAEVLRQLTRYAALPDLDALVLVTTRAKHHNIPVELNGKPLRLVTYVTAGL